MRTLLVAMVVTCWAGCGTQPKRLQDGSYRMECASSLSACSKKVQLFCKDQGYQVLHGAEENTLVGVEGQQTGHLLSRVVFLCSDQKAAPEPLKLPPRDSADSAAPGLAPGPGTQARVCIPGATQRCVGAGACEGGQACLPDGSGYGRCECASDPAAAPAPQPDHS